jgi:hypothetical protein
MRPVEGRNRGGHRESPDHRNFLPVEAGSDRVRVRADRLHEETAAVLSPQPGGQAGGETTRLRLSRDHRRAQPVFDASPETRWKLGPFDTHALGRRRCTQPAVLRSDSSIGEYSEADGQVARRAVLPPQTKGIREPAGARQRPLVAPSHTGRPDSAQPERFDWSLFSTDARGDP